MTNAATLDRRPIGARPLLWVALLLVCVVGGAATTRLPVREAVLAVVGLAGLGGLFALGLRDLSAAATVFFLYLSIDGMLRLALQYHPAIHVALDALTWTLVAAAVARASLRGGLRLRLGTTEVLLMAFALICLAQIANPSTTPLLGLLGLKVHYAPLPFYFLGYHLRRTENDELRFVRLLCGIATFVCAFALVQYLTGPDFWKGLGPAFAEKIAQEEWWTADGTRYFRPPSTTVSGAWPGTYAVLSIPLIIGLLMHSRFRESAPLLLGAIAMQSASLIISVYRGGWIALLGGLLLLAILRRTPRMIAVALGVALGCAIAVALTGGGVIGRAETLRNPVATFMEERGADALSIFTRSLRGSPFGMGTGTSSIAAEYYEALGGEGAEVWLAENYFVNVAVEFGVLGLVLVAGLLGSVIHAGLRAVAREPSHDGKAMAASLVSMVSTVVLMGLVGPILHGTFPGCYFWFMAGMLVRRSRETAAPVVTGGEGG